MYMSFGGFKVDAKECRTQKKLLIGIGFASSPQFEIVR